MKRRIIALTVLLAALVSGAHAAEGGAMLPLSALQSLQDRYEAFLQGLEAELLERGLLTEEDREAWYAAQLGDYFSNGGYGSILITYQPDAMHYMREEDMALELACRLADGTLKLDTLRRYAPGDSTSDGLMLSFSLTDASGMPRAFVATLSSDTGVFAMWDALSGKYASVGQTATTGGEAVLWSAYVPAKDAQDALLSAVFYEEETGELIGEAQLRLTVDGDGYRLQEDALSAVTQ
ncbi:MAG: hypothetical protein IJ573_04115 [Clostridia bacterium]|nr:hypothetical protein [Clostridia bacterium]